MHRDHLAVEAFGQPHRLRDPVLGGLGQAFILGVCTLTAIQGMRCRSAMRSAVRTSLLATGDSLRQTSRRSCAGHGPAIACARM